MQPVNSRLLAGPSRISIGSIIRRTFKVLFANPVLFFGLSIIAVAFPTIIMFTPIGFHAIILAILFLMLIRGSIAFGVYQTMRGEKIGIAAALKYGMSRFFPVLGASAIMAFALRLGMRLLILPGLYLATRWFVAIPACAVERRKAVECFGRSAQLIRGNGWQIFILAAAMCLLQSAALFVPIIILRDSLVNSTATDVHLLVLIMIVTFVIVSTFENVMQSVTFYDLLVVREGTDLDSLVSVFE